MSFNEYWVSSYREEATQDTSNMMTITNLTDEEKQTETFQKKKTCSPSLAGGLQYKTIYLSTVNILLLITAFHGNFLIFVALHRESSLHPPSKHLYRCLATTDLLVGLVSQPFNAVYWMLVVHKRYPRDAAYITSYALCVAL